MKLLLCVALMAHVHVQGALEGSTAVNLRGTQHVGSQEAQLKNNADMGILMRIKSLAAWCKNKIVAHPLMATAGALGVSGVAVSYESRPRSRVVLQNQSYSLNGGVIVTVSIYDGRKHFQDASRIFQDNIRRLSDDQNATFAQCVSPTNIDALVACKDQQVVGFITYEKERFSKGRIHLLAVDEQHRRKGISELLLKAALTDFKNQGIQKVLVYTDDDNENALALYKKIGFGSFKDKDRDVNPKGTEGSIDLSTF